MTELKLEKTIGFISFYMVYMHPYGFFFVRRLGSREWLEGEAVWGHPSLLSWPAPVLWSLLGELATADMRVWMFQGVLGWCNERTFLLTTCPELGSGGRNTGDTSPWDRAPRSSSCRLSKAWESVSCRVVCPCSWWSECDTSWTLDQQCVPSGSPNKFHIVLIMKDFLSQKVTLLS